jgi:hypothetical protein
MNKNAPNVRVKNARDSLQRIGSRFVGPPTSSLTASFFRAISQASSPDSFDLLFGKFALISVQRSGASEHNSDEEMNYGEAKCAA